MLATPAHVAVAVEVVESGSAAGVASFVDVAPRAVAELVDVRGAVGCAGMRLD